MKQCNICKNGGEINNFTQYCSALGYNVVVNRANKTRAERNGRKSVQVEICRAEELGKGEFRRK